MADIPRFGANDFYITETDPLVWREKLRAALAEVLGRDVVDADPHMVLASAFLPFLVQGQASADAAAKATLRAFAVGADLDRIADSTCVVGYMDRLPARGAILACILSVEVTRPTSLDAVSVAVTWAASRDVDAGGDVVTFSATGTATVSYAAGVSAKTLHLPMYLICGTVGAAYNGLLSSSVNVPVQDSAISADVSAVDDAGAACTVDDVSVSRCGSTYGGTDTESDESFAERSAWQAKALRVPGSLEYFRLLLSDLHLLASSYVAPTVDTDGRIIMAWCDKVDYYAGKASVSLDDRGAAYAEFREAVQRSLLVEQRVMAYPAREAVGVLYGVRYWLPASTVDVASARASVERAWRAYVSAHAWHCGAILSTSEMCAVVMAAGASSVTVQTVEDPYVALPADTIVTDGQLGLAYRGLSTDSAAPAGSDGEEITP